MGLSLLDNRPSTFGEADAEGDFCDEDCLTRYLAHRADERRKRES